MITVTEFPPKKRSVQATHEALQPGKFGIQGQWGLLSGESEGCGKQRLHSQSVHTFSYALGLRAETVTCKKPGSGLLADLGNSPREAGGIWDSPWGHR